LSDHYLTLHQLPSTLDGLNIEGRRCSFFHFIERWDQRYRCVVPPLPERHRHACCFDIRWRWVKETKHTLKVIDEGQHRLQYLRQKWKTPLENAAKE
jgi:hypothetical protein